LYLFIYLFGQIYILEPVNRNSARKEEKKKGERDIEERMELRKRKRRNNLCANSSEDVTESLGSIRFEAFLGWVLFDNSRSADTQSVASSFLDASFGGTCRSEAARSVGSVEFASV
jgi:hypothetical protein